MKAVWILIDKLMSKEALYCSLFFGISLYLLLELAPSSSFNPYLVRDYLRAKAMANGEIVLLGPDTLTGVHFPSPLYYLLILPIVSLELPIWTWAFYLMALSASFTMFFCIEISKRFLVPASALFPWLMGLSLLSWNQTFWPNNSTLIGSLVLCWMAILSIFERSHYFKNSPIGVSVIFGLGAFAIGGVHTSLVLLLPLFLLTLQTQSQIWKTLFPTITAVFSFFGCYIVTCVIAHHFKIPFRNHLFETIFDFSLKANSVFPNFGFGHIQWSIQFATIIFVFTLLVSTSILRYKSGLIPIEKKLLFWIFIVMTITLPFSLGGSKLRYQNIWLSAAMAYLLVVLFIYSKNSIGIRGHRAIGISVLVLAFFSVNFMGQSPRGEPTVEDFETACAYLNKNKISFRNFISNSYEIMPELNESSFFNVRLCLNDDSESESPQFLIVSKNQKDFKVSTDWQKTLETPNYYFYQKFVQRVAGDFTQSNLTYPYLIDSALSLDANIKFLNRDFGDFTRNPKRVFMTKICDFNPHCDLYLFQRHDGYNWRWFLSGRALQTKWPLQPVIANIQNLSLFFRCDGSPKSLELFSKIGQMAFEDQNNTHFLPTWMVGLGECSSLEPSHLAADKVDFPLQNQTSIEQLFFFKEIPSPH